MEVITLKFIGRSIVIGIIYAFYTICSLKFYFINVAVSVQ